MRAKRKSNALSMRTQTHATSVPHVRNMNTRIIQHAWSAQHAYKMHTSLHQCVRHAYKTHTKCAQGAFNMRAARKTHKLRATRVQHACKKHTTHARRTQREYHLHMHCARAKHAENAKNTRTKFVEIRWNLPGENSLKQCV